MGELDYEENTDVTGVIPVFVPGETTGPIASELRLICVAGPDLGRTFQVRAESTLIGRGLVDVMLNASEVSRNHARIVRDGTELVVVDLTSANGTYVNGTRVAGKAPVRVGDRIQVGSTILLLVRYDELEERMRRLQRLEAMGTLACGVAHDFNNALTIVSGNLQLMRYQLQDPELLQMIDEMIAASSSAANLAKRLMRLGRNEPTTYETMTLATIVERSISAMRRQTDASITVSAHVPPTLKLHGSQHELTQVLVNLFLNARDAMPRGGRFSIEARQVKLDAGAALSCQVPAAGAYIELAIADTGAGMDDATLARLFEPFFTTKPVGKGTGLGLAMVHGIVRRHGGAIAVASAPGKGTTFTIHLPLH